MLKNKIVISITGKTGAPPEPYVIYWRQEEPIPTREIVDNAEAFGSVEIRRFDTAGVRAVTFYFTKENGVWYATAIDDRGGKAHKQEDFKVFLERLLRSYNQGF